MFKKKLHCFAMLMALIFILSACSPIVEEPTEQVTVYATFYPIYALASMITQDIPNLELHCLVQPQDGCLREYTLSDWDLYLLLYAADGVLAGGSGLESFTDELEELSEDYFSLAEVFYGLSFYQGTGTEAEDGEGGHFNGDNPHLYLSVDGAIQILESMSASMGVLDVRYAEQYNANLEQAKTQLEELKEEIREETTVCKSKKTAVLNETLFYPAQDYGMDVVCQIERESGEGLYGDSLQDAIDQIRESGAEVVLIEEQAPKTLIDALTEAGFAVAKLDTLSTHSEEDGVQGYLEALRNNAKAAAEACMELDGSKR